MQFSRRDIYLVVCLVVAILTGSGIVIYREYDETRVTFVFDESPQGPEETHSVREIYVHVAGSVVSPGVYSVPDRSRLFEVLELAGGLTEDADPDALNLAAEVRDGQRIFVPAVREGSEGGGDSLLVSINRADRSDLQRLPGVGEAIAERIVRHREENGPFNALEELMDVAGIGERTFEGLSPYITL